MKKSVAALLGGLVVWSGVSSVSAQVDTPMTTSFESFDQFKVVEGQELLWAWGSDLRTGLIDLQNGERLQSLPQMDPYYTSFDVSDDQSRRVEIDNRTVVIYDEFGTKLKEIQSILNKDEEIYGFIRVKFLPDSHTLILLAENDDEEGKLLSYDVDTEELLSVRGTSHFGEILTARDHVAVIAEDDAYIFTPELAYKGVIHPKQEDGIAAFEMSKDGLLVMAENERPQLDLYDLNQGLQKTQTGSQFVVGKGVSYGDIAIDETGEFIAVTSSGNDTRFRLFERETGRRVYTSLDASYYSSKVALTKGAQSIILRDYDQTSVFSGKDLYKRPASVKIPVDHQNVARGSSETLGLEVTRADGKTVIIKSGVQWATNNPSKAYIKSGKLYGKAEGAYTLKATYEGFTTTVNGKVTPPPKLSSLKDVPWLERHRQSLLDKQSFEGLPALAASYSSIQGAKGSMFIPETDAITNGKWKGSVLAARFVRYGGSQPNKVELLTMLPALEKRSITKAEIKSAFGKPVSSENYSSTVPFHFSKSNKTFAKYAIKSVYAYKLKNVEVEVDFDKNDNARFIHVRK